MNTMTTALATAGVKLPSVKYRIWNWLRDHPEKTCNDIETALGLGYPPAQALLEMETGGVLKVYSDVSRKTSGLTGVQYKIKRYSVVSKTDYKNTPSLYKGKGKAKTEAAAAVQAAQAKSTLTVTKHPVAPPAPPTVAFNFNAEAHANALGLKQARELYDYLKGVFA